MVSERTPVRCGRCGWGGSRRHPLARPCPHCGFVVHEVLHSGLYLLAFVDPSSGRHVRYEHAGHYLGWTQNLHWRLHCHRTGQGSRLVAVVVEAGLDVVVVRTWPGADRNEERRLKSHSSTRYCPLCRNGQPAIATCQGTLEGVG